MKLKLISLSFLLALSLNTAWADDFVPEGEDDFTISANTFTLDGDDTGGDITLQFGATLAELLQWDSANSRFSLSSSLDLQSNELVGARVENLASAPTCDGTKLGQIYYNTTDKLTYSCDGAGVWNPFENALNATIEFPVVQSRRTTSYTLTATYADVTLDTTDLENDVTTLDHDDTLRDRIDIGATAMYQIIYGYTAGGSATATHEARARVRVNDTTVLPGSMSVNKNYQGEFSTTSASFLANLTAGDFISLQLQRDATTDVTQDEIYFSIVKLEGIKGDPGPAGADGADGAPGSVGLGTNENTFTLDQDDTGGDVTLQFGTTLAESLTWDNTNTRFNLSDDLRVGGVLEASGTSVTLDADNAGAGANVSLVAEQGTDNNGELRYNATNNEWEISNDGGAFNAVSTNLAPSVFYAYDGAGAQVLNATEVTLNIDTPVVVDANYALAADEVTVTAAGLYRITTQLGVTETNTSGGARTSHEVRLQENNVDIPGAMVDCYQRELEENACSLTVLDNVAAGATIRTRVQRTGGNTNAETLPDASRLIIERIR